MNTPLHWHMLGYVHKHFEDVSHCRTVNSRRCAGCMQPAQLRLFKALLWVVPKSFRQHPMLGYCLKDLGATQDRAVSSRSCGRQCAAAAAYTPALLMQLRCASRQTPSPLCIAPFTPCQTLHQGAHTAPRLHWPASSCTQHRQTGTPACTHKHTRIGSQGAHRPVTLQICARPLPTQQHSEWLAAACC